MTSLLKNVRTDQVIELPEGGSVRLIGVLDVQNVVVQGRLGLRPIRLPRASFSRFPDYEKESLRTVVSGCSGVHLRVETEADSLSLAVRCTRVDYGELPSVMNSFVACVDDKIVSEQEPSPDVIEKISRDGRSCESAVIRNGSTLVFSSLGYGRKTVTIWLPQTTMVDLIGIQGSDDADVVASARSATPRWLHYGSSISHCHSVKSPLQAWPAIVSRKAGLELTSLGFAGQCMLDPFVAQSIAASEADVISLSIGVNITGARAMNQRTFVPAVHGFLDIIRERHPHTPIVLVSSILWPGSEDVPGPSDVRFNDDGSVTCYSYGDPNDVRFGALTLADSRRELQSIVDIRHDEFGENIQYVNGLSLFGPDDVDEYPLPDGLHPDAKLYAEIAGRFYRQVFAEGGLVPVESLIG